ncbi:MAG: C-GCAxxG-C-C family protein [Steroidobacteraceae bacterium]|nr:C-GCAxxG-C-C family protein [Steroidobacteraceae bacterium]
MPQSQLPEPEVTMGSHHTLDGSISRRSVLAASAALVAGGGIGVELTALAASPAAPAGAPPLPWKWVRLDPLEAGQRAYRYYKEKGGCGSASYLSLLSLLREKAGHPWTTLPDMLMVHAAAGFGGHGTLCGALAGASVIINLVTFGEKRDEYLQNNAIVDRLFWWYAEQDFPTERFDDLSPLPKQIKVKAMSPLCHTSVSKWSLAAGVKDLHDPAKVERCAKVAGEVVYIVVTALNEFFDGKWVAPVWQPSKGIEHCIGCHGPATPEQKPRRWNQQGHMECRMCHEDHTA